MDVILAVKNGEKYLSEMLRSIKNQRKVSVNLIVSDDGSNDKSISIIKQHLDSFKSLHIVNGPQEGPALNFFSALELSNSPYLAFADQDDIWDKDHLINSILRIQKYDNVPSLSFSAVFEFTENSKETKLFPKKIPNLQLHSLFSENPARGCTIVMNKKAVIRILGTQPQHMIMHDWWALLLIFLTGNIAYSPSPEVWYRVHNHSATSGSRKISRRFCRFYSALKRQWEPELQINAILKSLAPSELNSKIVNDISFLRFKGIRRIRIIFYRYRFRERIIDEIFIRIVLLFRKSLNGL